MQIFFYVLFIFVAGLVPAEQFVYKHRAGDAYRILSTVQEDVYLNRRLNHSAEILNRIAANITGVHDDQAHHVALFQTAQRIAGESFQWEQEYESEFDRDRFGVLTIDTSYFMPVVRNVPVFPDYDLAPGETWEASGHEMHDFRESFGIPEPYQIPFTAQYVFLGNRDWKEHSYPAFSVSYRIFYEPDQVPGELYPVRIMGASDQVVYWDSALGQPVAYTEEFRMIFDISDGTTIEYRGSAQAELLESERMNKDQLASDIAEEIERLGIAGAEVKVVDGGITISMDNIQFKPDQAVFLPGEEKKLDEIGTLLLQYSDRDIMVGGHTARAGSEKTQMSLSQERASVVADYLIKNNVRTADRIVVRGFGATQPLADNGTEAGRQKNRRVEITILEN